MRAVVSKVVREATAAVKELSYPGMVVMDRQDLRDLLASVAREAFEAGRAAGPARKPSPLKGRRTPVFDTQPLDEI
jgi:hypothetical protein